ncbi:MAG: hypothetical protein RJQ09_20805 [Cyclobacteriaceae bacterium]
MLKILYLSRLRQSLSVTLMLISTLVFGQDEWAESGEIESAEVIIEKDREVVLPQANRFFDKVPPSIIDKQAVPQTYDFTNYEYNGSFYQPQIKVQQLPTLDTGDDYKNYVKLGYGNLNSPLGELSLNTSNQNVAAGLSFRHLSFGKGPVNGKESASSDNEASLYGRFSGKKAVFSANLDFNSYARKFYGYNPSLTPEDFEVASQRYNRLGVALSLRDNDDSGKVQYNVGANYYNLSDDFEASENGFNLSLESASSLTDNIQLIINANSLLTTYEDGNDQNRNLTRFQPGIRYQLGELSILGGANLAFANDTIANASDFNLYPHIEAFYKLSNKWAIEAGITGDLEARTLDKLVMDIKFLSPQVPLVHANKQFEFNSSITGSIGQHVGIKVGGAFATYENLNYLINSPNNVDRTFQPIYDEKADRLNLFTQLMVSLPGDFTLNTRLDYFGYGTNDFDEAYHRPELIFNFNASKEIIDKLNVAFGSTIISGIKVLDSNNFETIELAAGVDLNLNLDYSINEQLHSFIQLNNIIGNEYKRLLFYQVRPFMLHAGFSYSF